MGNQRIGAELYSVAKLKNSVKKNDDKNIYISLPLISKVVGSIPADGWEFLFKG